MWHQYLDNTPYRVYPKLVKKKMLPSLDMRTRKKAGSAHKDRLSVGADSRARGNGVPRPAAPAADGTGPADGRASAGRCPAGG